MATDLPPSDDDGDPLALAVAAMDAALAAEGADRHTLMDEALRLWRLARYARGEISTIPPDEEGGS